MKVCRKYAWGHDDLSPVSLTYSDPFQGWGASIADALDTMVHTHQPLSSREKLTSGL